MVAPAAAWAIFRFSKVSVPCRGMWLEFRIQADHYSWTSIRLESDGAAYIDLTAKGMTVPFGRRHVVRKSRS